MPGTIVEKSVHLPRAETLARACVARHRRHQTNPWWLGSKRTKQIIRVRLCMHERSTLGSHSPELLEGVFIDALVVQNSSVAVQHLGGVPAFLNDRSEFGIGQRQLWPLLHERVV